MSEEVKKKKSTKLITLPPREPDPGLTLVFNLDQQRFAKMGEVVAIQNVKTNRRIRFLPAWDHRGEPGDKRGCNGATLIFEVQGEAGAVTWSILTNWMSAQSYEKNEILGKLPLPALPRLFFDRESTRGILQGETDHALCRPIGADVILHSLTPREGTSPLEDCLILDGRVCHGMMLSSLMHSQALWHLLVTQGEEPIWRELETRYADAFPENSA